MKRVAPLMLTLGLMAACVPQEPDTTPDPGQVCGAAGFQGLIGQPEAALSGVESGESVTWRYALPRDTLTYQASTSLPGGVFRAEMRGTNGGIGRVELDFAASVHGKVTRRFWQGRSARTTYRSMQSDRI